MGEGKATGLYGGLGHGLHVAHVRCLDTMLPLARHGTKAVPPRHGRVVGVMGGAVVSWDHGRHLAGGGHTTQASTHESVGVSLSQPKPRSITEHLLPSPRQ